MMQRVIFAPTSRSTWQAPLCISLMVAGLALIYRGEELSTIAVGAGCFGVGVLWRPDLGLLFVPVVAPLYLIPIVLPGLRREGEFLLPLYEFVLAVVFIASILRWIPLQIMGGRDNLGASSLGAARRPFLRTLRIYAPHLLVLFAGLLASGLLGVIDLGESLRSFRRLIVEPLLFYALVKLYREDIPRRLVAAFILSGVLVALLGLLQFIGIDLVPLLGKKRDYSESLVKVGDLVRVTSVYGHPNNVGLYLGRVWPIAAAVGLGMVHFLPAQQEGFQTLRERPKAMIGVAFLICALICLAGIVVSFSRGAWLGVAAAMAVLGIPVLRRFSRLLPGLIGIIVLFGVISGFALTLRGDRGSVDARVLLWREAVTLIEQHPFGLGLNQFYWYHNPDFGHSHIDPALLGSSERYASHPHNMLLDLWLNLGPLGLLAFGWLLVRFFRLTLRNAVSAQPSLYLLGGLGAMVAALVHGIVDNFYFLPDLAMSFWILILLAEEISADRALTERSL